MLMEAVKSMLDEEAIALAEARKASEKSREEIQEGGSDFVG